MHLQLEPVSVLKSRLGDALDPAKSRYSNPSALVLYTHICMYAKYIYMVSKICTKSLYLSNLYINSIKITAKKLNQSIIFDQNKWDELSEIFDKPALRMV